MVAPDLRANRFVKLMMITGVVIIVTASGVSAVSSLVGCANDTDCVTSANVAAHGGWECSEVETGGSPCHINGRQLQVPPYTWPEARCACVTPPSRCSPAPPPSPHVPGEYGCRSGRCIQVLINSSANSSSTCEWSTGCVALADNEWLAATFEYKISIASGKATITCIHESAVLKKTEEPSSNLPTNMKIAIPMGTIIQLDSPPHPSEDGYWIVACANGTICTHPPKLLPFLRQPPRQHPRHVRTLNQGSSDQVAVVSPPSTLPSTSTSKSTSTLPTYLMIGDSISIGYFPDVTTNLSGKFNVVHSRGNAGNANNLAHSLDCYIQQLKTTNSTTIPPKTVITYNAGIHDLARGQEYLSLQDYTAFITNITIKLMRLANASDDCRVFWVTTTPVVTNATNAHSPAVPEGYLDSQVQTYNTVAKSIAKQHGVHVIDLYTAVTTACGGVGYTSCVLQRANNPHFVDAGWTLLANTIATAIESI